MALTKEGLIATVPKGLKPIVIQLGLVDTIMNAYKLGIAEENKRVSSLVEELKKRLFELRKLECEVFKGK